MKIENWPIEKVREYERNPRCNDDAVDAVAASIKEFGFRVPVIVDGDGTLIAGHTRLRAARQLGMTHVPVIQAHDLTPAQVRAFRLADNKTSELSSWDLELLPLELADLQGMDFDLGLLGFDPDELAKLLDPGIKDGQCDPDEVPEPPDEAVTKPGDLWLLGDHRLLCGDSTEPEHISQLMAGATARMMFTDPPWNVAIGQDSNPRHRQRPGLQNDSLSPDAFRAFLDGFVGAAKDHIAGDVYCVLGASEWPTLDSALRNHGYHWSATIIWVKDVFVLGRSKYHRRYEPIWYGWHTSGKSSFGMDRDLDDVWEIPRPKRSEDHPTTKPTALVINAIRNSSRPGDLVIDPFAGSGTTLIAAEQTGRRCCAVEIEPRFVDVVVRRWTEFTGRKAERIAAS